MLFLSIFSVIQRIAGTTPPKHNDTDNLTADNPWTIFDEDRSLTIECRFLGGLPWDSGDYFNLRSTPAIPYFDDAVFGHWKHKTETGIFLQKWNNGSFTDCCLVFIAFDDLTVAELKKSVPTKNWHAEHISLNEVSFTFTAANEVLFYTVELA